MIINLNGVELDFDMTNVDFYEKYMENADDLDVAMIRRRKTTGRSLNFFAIDALQ